MAQWLKLSGRLTTGVNPPTTAGVLFDTRGLSASPSRTKEEATGEERPGAGGARQRPTSSASSSASTPRSAGAGRALCEGHILIEDVPGVGKTMLAGAGRSLGCTFRRIQFTPDLLPSDVTGLSIFNQKTQEFEFRPGPIFAQIVLADEINRATPKTQSALLEAWRSGGSTVDGETYPMPPPFLVIATQNPIEHEGTFPLPEAQLDRFMLRLRLGYPKADGGDGHPRRAEAGPPDRGDQPGARASRSCARCRPPSREVYVDQAVAEYIVRLVDRHARARRRLSRRLAARLDRPVPRRPGAGGDRRPRLRHPRRREADGAGGAGPPADRQEPGLAARDRPGRDRARDPGRGADRRRPWTVSAAG